MENNEEKNNKSGKKKLIMLISALLGVIVLTAGIVLPILLDDEWTDDETVNPYAVVKLSNGMELTFDIWEKECPIAATNFIYLAEEGYFDGTVVFDNTGGWVRFGGWLTNGTHRGDDEQAFLDKYDDRKGDDYDYSLNKFGYRLKSDSARSSEYSTKGVLSFCYERSATEFQIAASNSVSLTVDGDDGGEWKVSPFGMASSETIKKLEELSALSSDDGSRFSHAYFRAPLDDNSLITIKSVSVRRKYEPKWSNFDFMDYFKTGADASKRLRIWQTSQRKSGK